MLQWDELRITPDGKFLIVDVEVQNLDYFKDVYLESLQMNVYSKADDFIGWECHHRLETHTPDGKRRAVVKLRIL